MSARPGPASPRTFGPSRGRRSVGALGRRVALGLAAVLLAGCAHAGALRAGGPRPPDPPPDTAAALRAAWYRTADPACALGGAATLAAAPCARRAPRAVACSPPTAWLRPADGWAWQEARRRAVLEGARGGWTPATWEARARRRSLAATGVLAAGAVAYGALVLGAGDAGYRFASEGWFGEHTTYGGADKGGHLVTANIFTAGLAALNRQWGLSRREAAVRGALGAFAVMAAIEVADGFSEEHGFSFEDLAMDALGAGFGYLHETSPWVNRTLDLRWEWWPSDGVLSGGDDPTTDYEGGSFLLAANVGALLRRPPGPLDLLDLEVGYRTRGYEDEKVADPPERWVFVGVGLDLASLLRRLRVPGAAIFEVYQLPWLSLRLGFELNRGDVDLLYGP